MNGCEGNVENEIEYERNCVFDGQFFFYCFVKDKAKGDEDKHIEHCPDRTEEPAWWCPGWGNELGAVVGVHGGLMTNDCLLARTW